jgi:hypothetical protein
MSHGDENHVPPAGHQVPLTNDRIKQILLHLFLFALTTVAIMLLWNQLVPATVQNGGTLSLLQAIGLCLLATLVMYNSRLIDLGTSGTAGHF